jgi:hypothetical protein
MGEREGRREGEGKEKGEEKGERREGGRPHTDQKGEPPSSPPLASQSRRGLRRHNPCPTSKFSTNRFPYQGEARTPEKKLGLGVVTRKKILGLKKNGAKYRWLSYPAEIFLLSP